MRLGLELTCRRNRRKGLGFEELSSETCYGVSILARLMCLAAAMKLVRFSHAKVHATLLSNGLAEEKFQKTIEFCYEMSRPSFNRFPGYFKSHEYRMK
jgi:hypothetical protein